MHLPFTVAEFLEVLRRYNEAVWPAQWALLALGVAAVVLALRAEARAGRVACALLAALWAWTGAVYHLGHFRAINPAAAAFGALFLAQAALLAWSGAWRGRLAFRARRDAAGMAGALLALYALVGYPAVGHALGHRYPTAPTFGLPCPLTILTFALLLWARPPVPRPVLVVPTLWAAIGTSAALQLGMREDLGLTAAGAIGLLLVLTRRPRPAARLGRA